MSSCFYEKEMDFKLKGKKLFQKRKVEIWVTSEVPYSGGRMGDSNWVTVD